jgi:hypothetical protein
LHRNGEAIPLHFVAHNKTNKKIPQTGILVVYFQLLSSPKGARGRAATPELLLEHQLKMPGSIRVSGTSITYFLHSIFADFL